MKASKLIEKIQRKIDKYGDINVSLSHDYDDIFVWFYEYEGITKEIMVTHWDGENATKEVSNYVPMESEFIK